MKWMTEGRRLRAHWAAWCLGVGLVWLPVLAGSEEAVSAKAVLLRSFSAKGQAGLERIEQDPTQALCTRYADQPLPQEVAQQIIGMNAATVASPSDGRYLGDWKKGEEIAQRGTGKQSSDDASAPAGGNCYACHQLSRQEIAYGTLGPSLYRYGKLRGRDLPVLQYTWTKIYNADASTACSNMPRFGHKGILTQTQIRDVMALLFDPASPVNQ